MRRFLVFGYGVICYLIFLGTFVHMVGFMNNTLVPKGIDSGPETGLARAVVVDALLIAVFGIQHSVMARQGFKRAWTRIIPQEIERSTYVLFASLALLLLFFNWEPIGGVIWNIESLIWITLLCIVQMLGWTTVLVSTFLVNHFDLFGLRQVYLYLVGRKYTPIPFRTPALYQYVRHPIYLGFLIAFWSTPTMTFAHLLFALLTTAYIFIGIHFEEKDLIEFYGNSYRKYKERVSKLIPLPNRNR